MRNSFELRLRSLSWFKKTILYINYPSPPSTQKAKKKTLKARFLLKCVSWEHGTLHEPDRDCSLSSIRVTSTE